MGFLQQNKWLITKQYLQAIELIYRQGIIDACESQDSDGVGEIIDLEYGYDVYIVYSEFCGRRVNISMFISFMMAICSKRRLNALTSYLSIGKIGALKKAMAYICFEFYKDGLKIGLKIPYENLYIIKETPLSTHIRLESQMIKREGLDIFIHSVVLKIQNYMMSLEGLGVDEQIKDADKLMLFINENYSKERERIWTENNKIEYYVK